MKMRVAGSPKATTKNDYHAADGLWYPSNRLESYLIQPSKYVSVINQLNTLAAFYGAILADGSPLTDELSGIPLVKTTNEG